LTHLKICEKLTTLFVAVYYFNSVILSKPNPTIKLTHQTSLIDYKSW